MKENEEIISTILDILLNDEEYADEWFDMKFASPYMQYAVKCKKPELIPSVVHADGTSRVQTVNEKQNAGLYKVLQRWYSITGVPVLLNTSLNIKGQPLLNDSEDIKAWEKYYNEKKFAGGGNIVETLPEHKRKQHAIKSGLAGKKYWNGVVNTINIGQSSDVSRSCVNAIDYLKDLCVQIVDNQQVMSPYQTGVSQTIYPWITGGNIATGQIVTCTSIITSIILLGTEADIFGNPNRLLLANRAFLAEEYLAYINKSFDGFTYNKNHIYDLINEINITIYNNLLSFTSSKNQKFIYLKISLKFFSKTL